MYNIMWKYEIQNMKYKRMSRFQRDKFQYENVRLRRCDNMSDVGDTRYEIRNTKSESAEAD